MNTTRTLNRARLKTKIANSQVLYSRNLRDWIPCVSGLIRPELLNSRKYTALIKGSAITIRDRITCEIMASLLSLEKPVYESRPLGSIHFVIHLSHPHKAAIYRHMGGDVDAETTSAFILNYGLCDLKPYDYPVITGLTENSVPDIVQVKYHPNTLDYVWWGIFRIAGGRNIPEDQSRYLSEYSSELRKFGRLTPLRMIPEYARVALYRKHALESTKALLTACDCGSLPELIFNS